MCKRTQGPLHRHGCSETTRLQREDSITYLTIIVIKHSYANSLLNDTRIDAVLGYLHWWGGGQSTEQMLN